MTRGQVRVTYSVDRDTAVDTYPPSHVWEAATEGHLSIWSTTGDGARAEEVALYPPGGWARVRRDPVAASRSEDAT